MQIKIYDDEEGARKAEIAQLGGQNVFSAFYERLKEVRDYHRKFPDTMPYEPANDEDIINSQVRSAHPLGPAAQQPRCNSRPAHSGMRRASCAAGLCCTHDAIPCRARTQAILRGWPE